MENEKPFVSAIIVAAGKATRMGANKMLLELGTKTVFERTVSAFDDCGAIDEIIVVASEENIAKYRDIVRTSLFAARVTAIVRGGASRQESVYIGLKHCNKNSEIVVIHDGARPLVKPETIAEVVMGAQTHGAAAAAIKSRDTIKAVDDEDFAVGTIDREHTVLIQTPQAFRKQLILEAHERAAAEGFEGTDDCALVERMGWKSKLIYLPYFNVKLTVPEDILLAKAVLTVRGKM
ncbi:MAG: 2-C-methyl-D-erythritol 4-phosphate cytidylyltransferase [Clostridia bacterium]